MSPIAEEYRRVARNAERMLSHGSYVDEVPFRLHSREVDGRTSGGAPLRMHARSESRASHDGLGGHALTPEFERYLRAAGVCFCEPDAEGETYHVCSRSARADSLRSGRSHPTRLKRALQRLRRASPASFDIIFPVVARGQTWEQVKVRVNQGRTIRGQEPYSDRDFSVHVVAGLDLLAAIF